jgi:hypothetical protein
MVSHKVAATMVLIITALSAPCLAQDDLFNLIVNGKVVADDGTFLGAISKQKYETNSLANKYGSHGGKYSSDSIFNKYGTYGSKYSLQSPFNKYTTTPPKIVDTQGRFVAYLTVNTSIKPRVDPYGLIGWLNH